MLTNTPKFSPKPRAEIFQINFPEFDEKHDKSALMEISQVFWTLSHCSLSKCVLKQRFLESGVTKIFTVSNLGNTLAMRIMFFFKMFII